MTILDLLSSSFYLINQELPPICNTPYCSTYLQEKVKQKKKTAKSQFPAKLKYLNS